MEDPEYKMQIHKIYSPYAEDSKPFYTDVPEEIPSELEIECPVTGRKFVAKYRESDEEDVRFKVDVEELPKQDD